MSTKFLANGTIVTYDSGTQSVKTIPNASLLIREGRIEAIGGSIDAPPGAEIIDMTGKILTPGFVNTHTHMWQTAFRSMNPNATLAEYFTSYSQYSESIKAFKNDDIYVCALQGYLDGLNGGVTSFVEHAHNSWNEDAVKGGFDAACDSGARVWWCHSFDDREMSVRAQWDYISSANKRSLNVSHPLVTLGLAYDQLGLANSDDVQNIKENIRKHELGAVTIHYIGEKQWVIGNSSPSLAAERGLQDLNIPIIFSHGGFITVQDRKVLQEHDWNLSITPESEMAFGHGQRTSQLAHAQASLGIDTNWQFSGDMLTQARLWLQHVRTESYTSTLETGKIPAQTPIKVESAFLLATHQGARAVRRNDIGVLEPGARADIVVFDGDSVNMAGWTNAVAAVMLHANVGDIQHVLVDGEFQKRDGKLVLKNGEDWQPFGRKFAEVCRRVQGQHPGIAPVGEKFFGVKEFANVGTFDVS